jgi:hypothetical protein
VDTVDGTPLSSTGNTPERPLISSSQSYSRNAPTDLPLSSYRTTVRVSDIPPASSSNATSTGSHGYDRYEGVYVQVPEHLRKPQHHQIVSGQHEELKEIELRRELALTIRNNPTQIFGGAPHTPDWNLARNLQARELEIAGDFGAYDLKEEGASSCMKQLKTSSAFIVFVQTIIMIAMLIDGKLRLLLLRYTCIKVKVICSL